MTSTLIVDRLSKEFSISSDQVQRTLEMIDAKLAAPFIGRVRRGDSGGLSEGYVRRIARRREELEELDRRRGTILRLLEGPELKEGEEPRPRTEGPVVGEVAPAVIERVKTCMDRMDLEDLFLPHRRPEPEVQLALDRGLGALADLLVKSVPASERAPSNRAPDAEVEAPCDAEPEADPATDETAAASPPAPESEASEAPKVAEAPPEVPPEETPVAAETAPETAPEAAPETAPETGGESPAVTEPSADEAQRAAAAKKAARAAERAAQEALLHGHIELTPALARLCSEFVIPDRGLHTETDALNGAMRILSDRLGRDTRLRGQIRRLLRKQGVLSVRLQVEESRLGRHKPLLKLRQPLRQIQGHRLLAIRQAQKERVLTTVLTLDRRHSLPKVKAALGKHTRPEFAGVLDAIALRTLEHRLMPLLEADVRLELKERADEEALRFLSQHLRQVLLTPPLGQRPVAGVDVNAKGDWSVALLDQHGDVQGAVTRIDTSEKDAASLGAELKATLEREGIEAPVVLAVGHGKGPRAGQKKLREALKAAGVDLFVQVVNESGLSSYASSELARRELSELAVPQRMAVSLGRRLQDPMSEILKIDPRHLGLGSEQGLVSKANLRRMFDETIESCTSHVACDVNRAPLSYLRHVPGLDAETAARLIERRALKPFESREELRSEGLLSEAQWTTAASFLRVPGSSEPLDKTTLHPEQYDLARRVIESAGGAVEDSLGRPGITKGLRRTDFDVDEHTWRDLMRELWHPGRDPRPPLFRTRLLDPDTDPVTLSRDRVVEGVVSNVASFGAFVDIGLANDAMVHVSEISQRYVRDARELLSIGQAVRARIKDASGQRLSLSLRGVPDESREAPRGGRPGRAGRGAAGRGRRGQGEPRERQESRPPVRAAETRRDGLAGARGRDQGRGRGGKGRPGGGHGPGRGDRKRRGEESVHPDDLRAVAGEASAYNPFATFFKEKDPDESGGASSENKETAPPQ